MYIYNTFVVIAMLVEIIVRIFRTIKPTFLQNHSMKLGIGIKIEM